MEIRLVGHVLSRELLTHDVDIGDMSFVAPEVLTFISLSGKGSLTTEEQAVKIQQFQQISSNSDVFSLSVLLHSLLFPDEVLRYKTIEEQVSAYRDDLRRPFVPNEFERENPEFIDLLRRGWEEQYRPELSEFVWSRVKPAGRKDR
jgi:serine/threonine protein kinase